MALDIAPSGEPRMVICPDCGGRGWIPGFCLTGHKEIPCLTCHGEGHITLTRLKALFTMEQED